MIKNNNISVNQPLFQKTNMKKSMSILLIIVGAFLIIVGIYSLQRKNVETTAEPAPLVSQPTDNLSDSERKGQQFEDYVIGQFAPAYYTLVEKVNDYTSRHHANERSKYADLVLRKKATGEEFAVECKYRSGWTDTKGKLTISWVDQRKIDDYNQFSQDRNIDVIVVFGVGGSPDHPEECFALPLRMLQKPLPQNQEFLKKYKAVIPFEYDGQHHNLQIIR